MSIVGDVGFRVGNQVATLGREVGDMSLEAQGAYARAKGVLEGADTGTGVFISLRRDRGDIIGFDVHQADEGAGELFEAARFNGGRLEGRLEGDTISMLVKTEGSIIGSTKHGWTGIFENRPDLLQGVKDYDLRQYAGRNPIMREWLNAPAY